MTPAGSWPTTRPGRHRVLAAPDVGVGAADRRGRDLHDRVGGAALRDRDLLDVDVPDVLEHGRPHRLGHRPSSLVGMGQPPDDSGAPGGRGNARIAVAAPRAAERARRRDPAAAVADRDRAGRSPRPAGGLTRSCEAARRSGRRHRMLAAAQPEGGSLQTRTRPGPSRTEGPSAADIEPAAARRRRRASGCSASWWSRGSRGRRSRRRSRLIAVDVVGFSLRATGCAHPQPCRLHHCFDRLEMKAVLGNRGPPAGLRLPTAPASAAGARHGKPCWCRLRRGPFDAELVEIVAARRASGALVGVPISFAGEVRGVLHCGPAPRGRRSATGAVEALRRVCTYAGAALAAARDRARVEEVAAPPRAPPPGARPARRVRPAAVRHRHDRAAAPAPAPAPAAPTW